MSAARFAGSSWAFKARDHTFSAAKALPDLPNTDLGAAGVVLTAGWRHFYTSRLDHRPIVCDISLGTDDLKAEEIMNQKKQQLQHNELADWLELKLEELKPYSNAILIAVLAVVVLIVGAIYVLNRQQSQAAQAWIQHFNAADAARLEQRVSALDESAKDNEGSTPGLWSRLLAADTHLKDGLVMLFQDRGEGEQDIETAVGEYDAVIEKTSEGSLLHQHALFGRAVAYEAMGDVAQALEGYQTLVDRFGDEAIGKVAQKYHDRLQSVPDAQAFMENFVSYEPSLTPPGSDFDLTPDATVPDLPDISFPEEGTETPATEPDQGGGSLPLAPPVDGAGSAEETETSNETETDEAGDTAQADEEGEDDGAGADNSDSNSDGSRP